MGYLVTLGRRGGTRKYMEYMEYMKYKMQLMLVHCLVSHRWP